MHILNHLYIKTNKRIDIALKGREQNVVTGIRAYKHKQARRQQSHTCTQGTNAEAEKQKGQKDVTCRFITTPNNTQNHTCTGAYTHIAPHPHEYTDTQSLEVQPYKHANAQTAHPAEQKHSKTCSRLQ